jgi:hypothetical protein
MRIRILRAAVLDLESGRDFYDLQESGVGDYFVECLSADIGSLTLYAGIHRVYHGFHRLIAKRFPYAVYYKMIGGQAVVFRVLDCRRSPARNRKALEDGTGEGGEIITPA